MSDFSLVLPANFDDYEWEVKAKGWFSEAQMTASGKHYRLNFFDPVRLAQEIESYLQEGDVFFEPNLLVVPAVTKSDMERAVQRLVQSGQLASLVAE
jgi:hypothetical protein